MSATKAEKRQKLEDAVDLNFRSITAGNNKQLLFEITSKADRDAIKKIARLVQQYEKLT